MSKHHTIFLFVMITAFAVAAFSQIGAKVNAAGDVTQQTFFQ